MLPKPASSLFYREFRQRLTGTAGLPQPSLGLSCCCWVPCSLAWSYKEASCRLGLRGGAAQALVQQRPWERGWKKPKKVLVSPAGDTPAACSVKPRVTICLLCCVHCYCVQPWSTHLAVWVCSTWTCLGQMQEYDQLFDTIQPVCPGKWGKPTNLNTYTPLSHTDIHTASGYILGYTEFLIFPFYLSACRRKLCLCWKMTMDVENSKVSILAEKWH